MVFATSEDDAFADNFGHLTKNPGEAVEEVKVLAVPPVPNRFAKQYSNLVEGDSENFAGLERVAADDDDEGFDDAGE